MFSWSFAFARWMFANNGLDLISISRVTSYWNQWPHLIRPTLYTGNKTYQCKKRILCTHLYNITVTQINKNYMWRQVSRQYNQQQQQLILSSQRPIYTKQDVYIYSRNAPQRSWTAIVDSDSWKTVRRTDIKQTGWTVSLTSSRPHGKLSDSEAGCWMTSGRRPGVVDDGPKADVVDSQHNLLRHQVRWGQMAADTPLSMSKCFCVTMLLPVKNNTAYWQHIPTGTNHSISQLTVCSSR